jgi:hypothetical protein
LAGAAVEGAAKASGATARAAAAVKAVMRFMVVPRGVSCGRKALAWWRL